MQIQSKWRSITDILLLQWTKHLDLLEGLKKHADKPELQKEWAQAKLDNKVFPHYKSFKLNQLAN